MKKKVSKRKMEASAVMNELTSPHYIGNKQLLEMIIALFTAKPEYRDMRMETVLYMVDKVCENITNLEYIITFAFTADRYFRYIQQKMPALRGKTWKSRQLMSGEKGNFEMTAAEKAQADEVLKQLKLF